MASYIKSTYLLQLEKTSKDAAVRYTEKTKEINVDPYSFGEADFSYEIDGMPPISNMDIVSYLVLTHSYYTREQMKAYKSLQAYTYFISGFVDKIGIKLINNYVLLVSKVQHSMKAREPKLRVWVLAERDGGICTAHVTCMAGLGEVCSHIAGVLYASEHVAGLKATTTCTDKISVWIVPSQRGVDPTPVRFMDWGKPSEQKKYAKVPTLDKQGIETFLRRVEKEGYQSPLMRFVSPFAEEMRAPELRQPLPLLFNIYNKGNELKTLDELINIGAAMDIKITKENVTLIEENTRDQYECEEWYRQRVGRITASVFKKVCHTRLEKPSISLIRTICYPTKMAFTPKAIDWDRKYENTAVKAYIHENFKKHTDFTVNKVGFLIFRFWPCLGASPDRLVFCECCSGGVLEVKCPYILKSGTINLQDFTRMRETCLVFDEHNNIILDEKHIYFYQVQAQIFICNIKYGDFVIWSPSFLFVQRIYPNFKFWEINLEKALTFHSNVIMPELLGHYYSKRVPSGCITKWCFCGGIEDETMIKCENDECQIIYFHMRCVSLEVVLGSSMCPKCNILLSHNYL